MDAGKPSQNPSTNPIEPAPGLKVEVEHNIPIKQPEQQLPAVAQVAPVTQFVQDDGKDDKDLDNALKDASLQVKNLSQTPVPKTRFSLKKFLPKKHPINRSQPSAKPQRSLAIIAAAFLIAIGLAAAAYYSYKDQPSKSKTTATTNNAASHTPSNIETTAVPIKTADITTFTNDLKSKIDTLNDSDDFNSADLSDQNLGL
jgi:hypothetical protein